MKKFCPPLKKVQGGSVCCSLIHRVNPKSPSESSQNPDDLADGCSVNEEESPNGQFIVGNESVPLVDSSGSVDLQESGLEADLGDPPRMAPEVIEQKIREIARDIALQCNKSNTNVADKRNDQENVAKTKQRLTYHEKRNKNHQLFNENIKEDSMDNSTMYSCKTCSSFPSTINRIAAERHAKTHGMHKKRKRDRILSYKCSFCEEKFRTKRANIEHYQTKHCEKGLRRITCTKCLKCFDDTASLKLHIKTVHLELKGYQCDQCEKTFRDLYSLNIHIQSHSEVHHLCSLCGNMFELKWLLNRHIQSVHKGVKIFKCIRCDKSFRDKYGLTRHISEGHRGNEMQENMGEEVDNSDDKENMSPGMIQQQKKKQVCPLCQQSVKRLNKHLKAKHGVNKFFNSDFSQNKYQCKSCGKPMRDKFNLTRHETNCEKEKQTTFQCNNCGKKFFSKQNLKIHVKMIHKTSKSCGKCKVIFETKYQFYEHLPCQHTCECLQQFSSFRSLILHQKKCTTSNGGVSESEYHNVISYKCGVCAIDGIPGEDLRLHVENHEVKDSISRCGLCLLDVSNLVDHIFDKHHVVRRLKKSYIQFKAQVTVSKAAIPDKSRSAFQENSENLLNLSSIVVVKEAVNAEAAPSAFAVKSKPNVQVGDSTKQPKPWVCHVLDIVSPPAASPPGFIEDKDGDSSKHVIYSVSQEVVEIATSDGGKTASITGFVGAVKSKPDAQVEDDSLPESSSSCQNVNEVAVTDGGIASPTGLLAFKSKPDQVRYSTEPPNDDVAAMGDKCHGIIESDSDNEGASQEIDLDRCLALETDEQREFNEKLDMMDKRIVEDQIEADDWNRKMDVELEAIKDGIRENKKNRLLNNQRASKLSEIELEEIKSLAQSSLLKMEEKDNSEIVSTRRRLYHSSNGEQQSLLYRQIWHPFSDYQHEWHKERGDYDSHYMWNVSLPELFLQIYQSIFNLESEAEAERSIFNTSLSEE